VIAILLAAAWPAGSVMELAATNLQAKIFWVKFEAVWMLPSATGMACFVLEYAWPGRWLNRRNLTLLSIPPLILLGIILTDNRYHLMWRGFDLNGTVFPQLGIGGWLGILYSFGLVFLIITIFAWLFSHSPPLAGSHHDYRSNWLPHTFYT
jgi:hypothetical protein